VACLRAVSAIRSNVARARGSSNREQRASPLNEEWPGVCGSYGSIACPRPVRESRLPSAMARANAPGGMVLDPFAAAFARSPQSANGGPKGLRWEQRSWRGPKRPPPLTVHVSPSCSCRSRFRRRYRPRRRWCRHRRRPRCCHPIAKAPKRPPDLRGCPACPRHLLSQEVQAT
jgi:hypothetical protein